jgi:hypothetical protein
MARAKGRDLVIEVLDAVEKLQATTARHSEHLQAMAARAERMSAQVVALSEHAAFTSQRLTTLEAEFQRSAEDAKTSYELSRSIQTSTVQLARVLKEIAGTTASRFDEIEDRLTRLERKAS